MEWRLAVINALKRYTERHQTYRVTRQALIDEELAQIIEDTQAQGETPHQTLSRVLQELRNNGVLYFTKQPGAYLFTKKPLDITKEALPITDIDTAMKQNQLLFNEVNVGDSIAVIRQRKGQQRLRHLTLINYHSRCAFCDITQRNLLIASHVVRWKDDVKTRGNLENVISMCRFHDTLFEYGFLSLSDNYQIIKKENIKNIILNHILNDTTQFELPTNYYPKPEFLYRHRKRTGFE